MVRVARPRSWAGRLSSEAAQYLALTCAQPGFLPASRCAGSPAPMDLYGKFTWKIENFSEISKRELRSNVFEVGSYKW